MKKKKKEEERVGGEGDNIPDGRASSWLGKWL